MYLIRCSTKICLLIFDLLIGTHTICFSISFYNFNQMPMNPRTNFHCETTINPISLQTVWVPLTFPCRSNLTFLANFSTVKN